MLKFLKLCEEKSSFERNLGMPLAVGAGAERRGATNSWRSYPTGS